jgi:hypothetical protein
MYPDMFDESTSLWVRLAPTMAILVLAIVGLVLLNWLCPGASPF